MTRRQAAGWALLFVVLTAAAVALDAIAHAAIVNPTGPAAWVRFVIAAAVVGAAAGALTGRDRS